MDFNSISHSAQDPFHLLPPEMCKMVTDFLKKDGSSRDLLNLSNAFERFQAVLKPSENEWKFHLILPFLIPYLNGPQILSCRTVCKTWRKDVDSTLANIDAWRPFSKEESDISRSSEYNPLQFKKIKWTTFTRTDGIERYVTEMATQRMKSKIVGGSLALREPTLRYNGSNIFWEKAIELLSTSEYQTKHLLLQPCNIKPSQFFHVLEKVLNYTPDLKTLQFDGYFTLDPIDYSCNATQYSSPETLLEYLQKNPLPRLKSLQTLELILLSNQFPIQVFQKMITDICPTDLKCLKLCYHTGNPEMSNPFMWQHLLANLTELHLINIKNEQEVERILQCVNPRNTQIEKLVLEFEDYLDDVDFDRLCTAINKLRNTLMVLAVKGVHKSEVDANIQKPTLRCLDTPKLKTLELEGVIFDSSLRLQIFSQSLEHLHIRCTYTSHIVHQFFQWLSNYFVNRWPGFNTFWNEMEKLKVLRIDVCKEQIWMNRFDDFGNIQFQNEAGYVWELYNELVIHE